MKLLQDPDEEGGNLNIILQAPFYGKRRRQGQHLYYFRTVEDMLNQAFAISLEAAMIIKQASLRWPKAKLLITGFSFGGAMTGTSACFASALLATGVSTPSAALSNRLRLGVVPCVGSPSPEVILDGVLAGMINYHALRKTFSNDVDGSDRKEEGLRLLTPADRAVVATAMNRPAIGTAVDARSFLHHLLSSVQTKPLFDAVKEGAVAKSSNATRSLPSAAPPPLPLFGAVSSVAALSDHFVRPRHTFAQFECLAAGAATLPDGTGPAAIIDTMQGGHVVAFLRRTTVFVAAVRRAVSMLKKHEGVDKKED
jgi:Alpha/beta hydrolase domain containing 18